MTESELRIRHILACNGLPPDVDASPITDYVRRLEHELREARRDVVGLNFYIDELSRILADARSENRTTNGRTT